MSVERPSSDAVHDGPEIIAAFVASLKKDNTLDPATVNAIGELLSKGKLTLTNLLRSLDEARGKTSI